MESCDQSQTGIYSRGTSRKNLERIELNNIFKRFSINRGSAQMRSGSQIW